MPRRYFNWKLAIVLVIGIVVLGTTAFGLRRWQRNNRAEQGLVIGNKAYDEQQWEKAAKNLGRYLAIEQNNVPALLKYANAQLKIRPSKRNNIQQAILAYRAVLREDTDNYEAAMRLTEIYLMMGMPGEAELIATRQLETNQNPELRRMLALALAAQRKFNEAEVQLKTILQEHPDQILAYETLGQLTEQRPDDFPDSPEDLFNQAVRENPTAALAYIARAGFYRRTNDSTKALADLHEAEKQDLSDPNVELRLAGEFINANVLDKAEEHLTSVQTSAPANQDLWAIWVQLALQSQSHEKMLKIAEAGLKELSSQPWDFMPKATELFIRSGQLDRAAECISKMNEKDIDPVTVAFLKGLMADEKGNLCEAIKYWKQSIELGNTSSQIRLLIASALSRLGNTQSALRHLRTLISERPKSFSGHLSLARLLAKTGSWADASEHAATAMQLAPENPEPALLYLQAQMQLLAAGSTGDNALLWQDMEKELSILEEANNGNLEIKFAKIQLALQQYNFVNAQTLITQLKQEHPSQIRIAMAEVDLLIAQDKINEAKSMLNKTIEEFPQDVGPVKYLAILLAGADEQEKCEAILKDGLARFDQPFTQREFGLLLAELYIRWNQKDNAYLLLNGLAQKLPDDIPLKRRLLLCEEVIKDSEKAQQLINDIKLLEGEDGWQWRYEQARIWFAADDFNARYPQIVLLLQENLRANPNDQASRILLATAYEHAGELQLAISTYRESVSRSPDDLRIIIPTVAALYKAKEYDEAEQLLNRTSERKLRHPLLKQLQLQSHLRRGELSLASDILQDFISNDPNNQDARFSLALLRTQQAKFDEAEKLLVELKTQNPDSLPVTYAQVQLSIRQDKPEEALRLCNELVNKLNNASAYILRARTYTVLEKIDEAVEDLEHATTIEPNNVDVWLARSEFYRSMGQPDKAIADMQHVLSLSSSDIQIQKRAIPLLFASGDIEKVRQGKSILEEALQSNPEDIDLQMFKAKSLLTEGTAPAIENATSILEKITNDHPETNQAWALLGEISYSHGQFSKALDVAMRGLAHTPNDRALLLLKARAEAERLPVLAIPTLKMLCELDPNDAQTAMLLADTYIKTSEPQKAVNLLKVQLLSHTGSLEERKINIALAVALHKNGDKADAQKAFDSLIQSEPNDPNPLLAQIRLLRDDQLWNPLSRMVADWYQKHPEDNRTPVIIAGELLAIENSQGKKIPEDTLRQVRKTAEDILHMVLKNDPDSTEAMADLAILLLTIGRSNESVPLYQRVLQLEPDNLIVINNLAWILCEEQGKFQEALKLAQRGLQIAPNYIDLIDTRGVVYYRLGEFNKAAEDFIMCIKLYPDDTPAAVASCFHLARAFAELGQRGKAVEYLNRALDLNSRIGGLLDTNLAEAQHLMKQLKEGN